VLMGLCEFLVSSLLRRDDKFVGDCVEGIVLSGLC